MMIIILLIFISLTIAISFLLIFLWAIKSGQYNDMYTPSVRILFNEKTEEPKENEASPDKRSGTPP